MNMTTATTIHLERAHHDHGREVQRGRMRWIRRAAVGALGVASIAAVALALRPRPVPIDAATVSRGPLLVAIEETGVTRVKDRFVVSAPIAGSVARSPFEAGDVVAEGDRLADIAPTLSPLLDERTRAEAEARLGAAMSALGQAKAQAARAETARGLSARELERVRTLAASASISAQAVDQAEFDARLRDDELSSATFAVKVATEEVRVARAALGLERGASSRHVDVVSPVSGRVLSIHQKSAGVVQTGAALVEIGDPNVLEVVVDLLTTDAVHVEPGTNVTIQRWGGDPLGGRVKRLEPSGFTKPSALGVDEQRVNVIVALTDPRERWAMLGDGYRVEARFVLWRGENVVKVPLGAVFRHGASWAAYRVDGGIAHLVQVEIGHRGESDVEIVSGLAPGVVVAVHPGDRVKDGARVASAVP
jgi:HlyD family secretion protein